MRARRRMSRRRPSAGDGRFAPQSVLRSPAGALRRRESVRRAGGSGRAAPPTSARRSRYRRATRRRRRPRQAPGRRCRGAPTAMPSPTNSCRNRPARRARRRPAETGVPPMFLRSAMGESMQLAGSLGQRQRPHVLAGAVGGGACTWSIQPSWLPITPAIRSPSARDARAGERGQVDDGVRPGSSTASDSAVGQHEPALRVGVQHLDGLAVADREHVAGRMRVAARHVVGAAHVADDLHRGACLERTLTSSPAPRPRRPCRSSSSSSRRRT